MLEVNASSQRTGKSILQLFGEATQSHHMAMAAQQGGPGQPSISSSGSLMLFDEVDLLLSHDKGFLPALRSLIADSKRPVILTCNRNVLASALHLWCCLKILATSPLFELILTFVSPNV